MECKLPKKAETGVSGCLQPEKRKGLRPRYRGLSPSPHLYHEAAIARSIITLAESLLLQVIPEGVETEQQLGYLRHHRCIQTQGYYFSRALPAYDFEKLLIEDNGRRFATDRKKYLI
jgi:hypothetical protein